MLSIVRFLLVLGTVIVTTGTLVSGKIASKPQKVISSGPHADTFTPDSPPPVLIRFHGDPLKGPVSEPRRLPNGDVDFTDPVTRRILAGRALTVARNAYERESRLRGFFN
jgi:hypothetical protein